MFDLSKSRLESLGIILPNDRLWTVKVLRDDLIDSDVSGNKWRKLKFNMELVKSKKKDGILTFGGAYSNHLVATAKACQVAGLSSIGLVRGEELDVNSNDTLRRCGDLGMKLLFISREEYGMRNDREYWDTLAADHPTYQIVPEGGANYYGMIGCQEILRSINPVDHVHVACGTGTTAAGIATGLSEDQTLHVYPVLKGIDFRAEIKTLYAKSGIAAEMAEEFLDHVQIQDQFHFGGYGKISDELIQFIRSVYHSSGLQLDPIYTGKAFYGMCHAEIDRDQTHVFIHTGGLQGIPGVEARMGEALFSA